jgi:hypothetical protein
MKASEACDIHRLKELKDIYHDIEMAVHQLKYRVEIRTFKERLHIVERLHVVTAEQLEADGYTITPNPTYPNCVTISWEI